MDQSTRHFDTRTGTFSPLNPSVRHTRFFKGVEVTNFRPCRRNEFSRCVEMTDFVEVTEFCRNDVSK